MSAYSQSVRIHNWTIAAHYDVPADVEREQLRAVAELANTAPEDVAIIAQVRRPQASEGGWLEKLRLRKGPEAWTGTRTYDLTGDARVVEESPSTARPEPRELGADLADALERNPSRHSAIVLGGHGKGYFGMLGMSVEDVAEALGETTRRTGRKADLLILHSCLMGNLETLRQLAPFAHYAVVSENTLTPRPLPLDEKAVQGDARALGAALVEEASTATGVTTQSLIDLSKVEALSQSLERLAPELERNPAETRRALEQPFPLGSGAVGVADLGILLHALGDKPAVTEAQGLLREAVVANKATSADQGSEGLSIRTDPTRLEGYEKVGGMPRWAHMLGVVAELS